ncbi:hypothetical protein [Geothrix limicola]|uniref:hypothetical protein n=1 Tax=Geothrix limicola TaxID=2927978 RepID=UPI002553E76E|nr:hypothetical protein [Geothrix limicola]
MRLMQMALWTALTSSLSAQGSEQGFQWMGIRAGTVSFDPQEHVRNAPSLGGQAGLVFDQQRFGLSFEGFIAHPKSDFDPTRDLTHAEFSATLLMGLSGGSASRFWPYFGLGLGDLSIPNLDATSLLLGTDRALAAHTSLGFYHRPGLHLIWGLEGRYLFTLTRRDLKEFQGSALFGFTWGGGFSARGVDTAPRPVERATQVGQSLQPAPLTPPAVTADRPIPAPLGEDELAPPPPPPPSLAGTAIPLPPVVPFPSAELQPHAEPASAPMPIPAPRAPVVVVPAVQAAPAAPITSPAAVRHPEDEQADRLEALRQVDLPRAVALGRKRIQAMAPGHWTIRLEIADFPATLKRAVEAFPGKSPDLFIAPIRMRSGRTSHQLFLGEYASKAEAERAARQVPAFFLDGGQRPVPFLGTGLPAQVGR